MPRPRLVKPAMRSICRASSRMALAPALEIDAGVRGASADRQGEIADAFAGGLELSGEAGARLEHQHRFAAGRVLFGERARGFAADLLVGIELAAALLEGTGISSSRRARTAKMKNAIPAFMSSTPGPQSRPSASRNGMSRRVPMRPDGIGVAERRGSGRSSCGPGSAISQTRWRPNRAACERLHCGERRDRVGDQLHEAIDGRRGHRWAIRTRPSGGSAR